jgi:hypothetical protein
MAPEYDLLLGNDIPNISPRLKLQDPSNKFAFFSRVQLEFQHA